MIPTVMFDTPFITSGFPEWRYVMAKLKLPLPYGYRNGVNFNGLYNSKWATIPDGYALIYSHEPLEIGWRWRAFDIEDAFENEHGAILGYNFTVFDFRFIKSTIFEATVEQAWATFINVMSVFPPEFDNSNAIALGKLPFGNDDALIADFNSLIEGIIHVEKKTVD